jgi:hypothetical protein
MSRTASALRDSDLVAFAAQGEADGRTSVIVEAKRPAVAPTAAAHKKTSTSPRELLPAPPKRRANAAQAAAGAAKGLATQMGELEDVLKQLGLADSARRNDLSGSFVVEVTPDQLRALACAPAVQAIRCNRAHRRVAA